MNITQPVYPFLIENFEEFYIEILRFKQKIAKYKAYLFGLEDGEGVDPNSTTALSYQDQLASHIQQKLKTIIEKQALVAKKNIGERSVFYAQEAHYAMVALTDEIFLNLDWDGRKQWEKSLLEAQLFKTQIAGEYIYQKIDLLLASSDPLRADLAMIYLMILGLGFQGQYKEMEYSQRLQWYKNELYKVIHQEQPFLFDSIDTPIQVDCYKYTLNEPALKQLPDMRLWGAITLITILIYIFVSIVIWHDSTFDLNQSIQRIFEQARAMIL